jgi:hypothetical protein
MMLALGEFAGARIAVSETSVKPSFEVIEGICFQPDQLIVFSPKLIGGVTFFRGVDRCASHTLDFSKQSTITRTEQSAIWGKAMPIKIPSVGRKWWGIVRKLLGFSGPGYPVAVGYMDPGNWATHLRAAQVFLSKPDFGAMALRCIPSPDILHNGEMFYVAIGILDAKVMPPNLYDPKVPVATAACSSSELYLFEDQ